MLSASISTASDKRYSIADIQLQRLTDGQWPIGDIEHETAVARSQVVPHLRAGINGQVGDKLLMAPSTYSDKPDHRITVSDVSAIAAVLDVPNAD